MDKATFLSKFSQPPPAKKKKDEAKEHKSTRVRTWQPQWKKNENGETRDWLVYDNSRNEMFCEWCRGRKDASGPFVDGTSNFKLESVKYHEASPKHRWATTCHFNALHATKQPTDMPAAKSLKSHVI